MQEIKIKATIKYIDGKKKYYYPSKLKQRKESGLCIRCGHLLEANNEYFVCLKCRIKHKEFLTSLKKGCFDKYGSVCQSCGEARLEFLCIDHINNEGVQHRKTFNNNGCGEHLYRWLKKNNYPEGFQVLCHNCNLYKSKCNSKKTVDVNLKEEQRCCNICRELKGISNFYRRSKRNDLMLKCKLCFNKQISGNAKKLKREVLNNYNGPKCVCCGETNINFLTIDHIKGKGNEHRKMVNDPKGSKLYRWLKKNHFPEGFRVLCMNCNFALGHFGHCPHQLNNV